jgi:hypothetical protein
MSGDYMASTYNFAHGEHFLDAIRSSGYKNAAMALGELVDNSLQAGAENVQILTTEHRVVPQQRSVRRIKEIAVLDDGHGMDPTLLRRALKLGDGTHFDDDEGIGKFGVGLPQASVSQAKRVDVWSWQDGIEEAAHTYIDLTDKAWVEEMVIPEPDEAPIPEKWKKMGDFDNESGTLVVWSHVDRCAWKRARTLYRHSQDLIGRMYREWLHPGNSDLEAGISLTLMNEETKEVEKTWDFGPNDPLYLMSDTTVELPEGSPDPPFEKHGSVQEIEYAVGLPDDTVSEETVRLTFSIAKPETRAPVDGRDAGHAPHGKHAKNNVGLSIVREKRELKLDSGWADKDPRNRWWGAQIEFGRRMDDIFGVTNNKQGAERLSEVADKDWEDFAEPGESLHETKERLKEEDFPTFVCLDIAHVIQKRISMLKDKVEEIGKQTPSEKDESDKRHEQTPEKQATEATEKRKQEGQEGESDKDEDLPAKE